MERLAGSGMVFTQAYADGLLSQSLSGKSPGSPILFKVFNSICSKFISRFVMTVIMKVWTKVWVTCWTGWMRTDVRTTL